VGKKSRERRFLGELEILAVRTAEAGDQRESKWRCVTKRGRVEEDWVQPMWGETPGRKSESQRGPTKRPEGGKAITRGSVLHELVISR